MNTQIMSLGLAHGIRLESPRNFNPEWNMDIFLDLTSDHAYAFTAFLQRLSLDDYRRCLEDEELAHSAMIADKELILAFRELGFITT